MKRIFFILSFLYFFDQASAQTKYSLKECIEIAIKNSNTVKQTSLQVKAAEVNYNQTKLNLLPTLNGNINHGINQGRSIDPFTNSYINQTINYASYSIGSTAILFNGFSMQHSIKQFDFAHDAATMDLQQIKDNLTLNVMLAYLQVLSNEDFVEQTKQQFVVSQKQVGRLEILNREGAINPPQLFDLKGQMKDNELTLVTAKNALAQSKLVLSQLMNIDYDPAMRVERISMGELMIPPVSTANETYKSAQENMAVVRAAEYRKHSANAALKAVRGQLFPTFFLNGNLNSNYSSAAMKDLFINSTEVPSNDYVLINGTRTPVITKQNVFESQRINYTSQLKNNVFSNVGLGIRIPIFNSLQTRNRIKLADIEVKNFELNEQETKRQLRQEVEQAYLNMQNAYERYKVTLEQVAAYAESFRAAEVRFNAGVGTSIDYLIAKNNYDRAALNLIMVQYDYLLRKKIVDFYNGERW